VIPHGFSVFAVGPGRAIVVLSPGGFDRFVAAAHGIEILPPPSS